MRKMVLCCVSSTSISEDFHNDLKTLFSKHHLQLNEIIHLTSQGQKAIDVVLEAKDLFDFPLIKTDLIELSNKFQIDMALLPHNESRTNKRLIVFDMDSTLIQHEVIDEMALVYGIGEKVKLITERAMNGEINFDSALRERVKLLKGLPRDTMEEIASRLKLMPGAKKLISEVKARGYKTAIVSGGFQYFANGIRERLGIDYAFANDLDWDGDFLSGEVKGEIINAEAKAQMLDTLSRQEGLTIDQTVAVGDGANDIPMLLKAGLGIAYHAKDKVRQTAHHQMSHGPMSSILYFLGIPGDHLDETL